MPTPFNCPACGGTIAAEVPAGSQVVCPLCRREITVPGQPSAFMPASVPPQFGGVHATTLDYGVSSGPRSQGMAIAALVCGILGLLGGCAPVGLLGLIFGIIATVRVGRNPNQYGGRGLAIGGIATGGLSLLLLPLLLAVFLPALSQAREIAKRTICSVQMESIGESLMIYAESEPNGAFPEVGADWIARLRPLTSGMPTRTFRCPADTSPSDPSYYYVPGYSLESDEDQIILYERPDIHRGEGGNVLYVSGMVMFIDSPQYDQLIDNLTLPDGTPWAPHNAPITNPFDQTP